MLRTVAVQRINDGLGFRASGNALEATIILRLQEAQRDLERGKTLPRFLLQEDQTLALVSGTSTVVLPTGFLRESDDNPPHYYPSAGSRRPVFLKRKNYREGYDAYKDLDSLSGAPKIFIVRRTLLDFVVTADKNYTLYWDYYKADTVLTSDVENEWLENAPEWLIGEAGRRIAADMRNADAVSLFDSMRQSGRAACFGEDLAAEMASGPRSLGENL